MFKLTLHKLEDLVCVSCGTKHGADSKRYSCTKCGGIIEVRYNHEFLAEHVSIKTFESKGHNLWKYFDLLPVPPKYPVILGHEGAGIIEKVGDGDRWGIESGNSKLS